jgi:hypothetical protein
MSNPYQPPSSFEPKFFQDAPPQLLQGSRDYGWVQQVRIYAILSAVQAALEIPLGLMLVCVGGMFPVMMQLDKNNPNRAGNGPPPEVLGVVMAVYITIGVVLISIAVLRLVAAYRNFYFKGRVLGLVAMSVGLLSMLTCYCAPTSIAVLIYGLIVYQNPAVRAAFAWGEEGRTPAEIYAQFMPYRAYLPQTPPGTSPFG